MERWLLGSKWTAVDEDLTVASESSEAQDGSEAKSRTWRK